MLLASPRQKSTTCSCTEYHLHRITITHDHTSWNLTTPLTPSVQRKFTQKSSSLVQDNARRELPSRFFMLTTLTDAINVGFLSFFSINIHKSPDCGQVSFVDRSSCSGSNCQFWTEPPWLGGLSWTGDRRGICYFSIPQRWAEPGQRLQEFHHNISNPQLSIAGLHLSRLRTRWAGLGQEPGN